jgi:hypothetical protein
MQSRNAYLFAILVFLVMLGIIFYLESQDLSTEAINATVDARVTQALANQDDRPARATIKAQETLIAGLLPTLTSTASSATPITPSPIATLTPTPNAPHKLYELDYRGLNVYVDWHPTENIVAFGHDDSSEIIIYDLTEQRELHRQQGLSDYIRAVRWSSDGRFLAAGDFNGRILVWDTSTWQELSSLALSGFVKSL